MKTMSFEKEAGQVLSLDQTERKCRGILEAGRRASGRCRTKDGRKYNRECTELYEAKVYHLELLKKYRLMEQTVNRLAEMVKAEIKDFSHPDKVKILAALSGTLQVVSGEYLMMEYGLMKDEG